MGEWDLAIVGLVLVGYAAVSARLRTTMLTSAIVFVTVGVVVGSGGVGWFEAEVDGAAIRALASATLAFVLFADASRIDLASMRRDYPLPARLLGVGLPLTIVAGALAAKLVWPELPWIEAAVLAVILAPTDAALGQAVVTDPRLPTRVSQGLNVESGLNDGICVPLLVILLTVADADVGRITAGQAVRVLGEEIGFGIVGGVVAALLGIAVIGWGTRTNFMSKEWRQVAGLATAGLAYGIADPLGGSGFIAAFVGGLVVAWKGRSLDEDWSGLLETAGGLLDALTFFVFGAVVLGPILDDVEWRAVAYALLSLTAVRMIPVAIALIGSRARWPTVGFVGWFGPRGLASIVFVVITIGEAQIQNVRLIALVSAVTVGLSVYAHGMSAIPLTERYRTWHATHPRPVPLMEDAAVSTHRWRWSER